MCDKLVFDLAQEVEGTPNVFVRKDWINLLDNQNQNYISNQSVIDTSQIANSNKYVSYREGYLLMPLTISLLHTATAGTAALTAVARFNPADTRGSVDNALSLKSWFGQLIHSFTLDYNGTTIVQQTPLANMWNSFKLMTILSYQDVITQGATIGFYPDRADSVSYGSGDYAFNGYGTTNNLDYPISVSTTGEWATQSAKYINDGMGYRRKWITFDPDGSAGVQGAWGAAGAVTAPTYYKFSQYYSNVGLAAIPAVNTVGDMKLLWKSYIYNKVSDAAGATGGIAQWTTMACIYLKHIHSFFNMIPLVKGSFMKMTLNLNNTTTAFDVVSVTTVGQAIVADTILNQNGYDGALQYNQNRMITKFANVVVSSPLGGVNPLMLTSAYPSCGGSVLSGYMNAAVAVGNNPAGSTLTMSYRMNISVGAKCLDNTIASSANYQASGLSQSVMLYVPTYQFNPVFEQAYLSSPIKPIKYTDIYQYQVLNVQSGQQFNNLITNGIANIKSILILPFYSSSGNSSFVAGVPQWQSPFDPAGTGATSPYCSITNFNVQISGQNAIYNMEKYNFEQFNNQLYGQNAVNGGLTDGLTSSLIDRQAFDSSYCYYYVNVERMLPVEQSVPKSVQIIGTNVSSRNIDLIVFVEYYNQVSIDVLTGARVA